MAQFVKLKAGSLPTLRTVDERLVSYNVEMTEVTGGTFWKAYTPGQIAGTEAFNGPTGSLTNHTAITSLMQYYPPIDLTSPKLRKLAKDIGPAWVRVSGTWSTKTYYDFDGSTGGKAPAGYQSVLTKEQWLGVLDFCRDIGAKLMISVANCEGLHSAHEPWNPSQAEQIFALSKEYGVPILAAEFMNEPNILSVSGAPEGYTAQDFVRDQDLFNAWLHQHYPECMAVGPCSTIAGSMTEDEDALGGGIADGLVSVDTEDLLHGSTEPMEVYSYHYYNGISERLASLMPNSHWPAEKAHTEAYLAVAPAMARANVPLRDKYVPGAQMWVTESGDAGGGGNTWASTYLDVLRTLNELGSFATITDGIIFHNTLASSDYGYLKPECFDPRPNFFAVVLWNRLMGTTVYDAGEPIREGAHVYAHSRRDGKAGKAYLVINNSMTEPTQVELPGTVQVYQLTAESSRCAVMQCNGTPLVLGENFQLPSMNPVAASGTLELPALSCTFLLTEE